MGFPSATEAAETISGLVSCIIIVMLLSCSLDEDFKFPDKIFQGNCGSALKLKLFCGETKKGTSINLCHDGPEFNE